MSNACNVNHLHTSSGGGAPIPPTISPRLPPMHMTTIKMSGGSCGIYHRTSSARLCRLRPSTLNLSEKCLLPHSPVLWARKLGLLISEIIAPTQRGGLVIDLGHCTSRLVSLTPRGDCRCHGSHFDEACRSLVSQSRPAPEGHRSSCQNEYPCVIFSVTQHF